MFGSRLYIIFPIDPFNFTFTTEVDLILDRWDKLVSPELKTIVTGHTDYYNLTGDYYINFNKFQSKFNVVKQKYPALQNKNAEDFIDLNSLVKQYEPNCDNLERAVKSGREVYISGNYYALSASYEYDLKRKMGLI